MVNNVLTFLPGSLPMKGILQKRYVNILKKNNMDLKNNQILVFRNTKKTNENQPDWKGSIDIEGVEHEVSLWENKSKGGNEYLSGSHKPLTRKNSEG